MGAGFGVGWEGRVNATSGNVFSGAKRGDLSGVERGTAGTINAVGTVDFANGEEAFEVEGAAPDVGGEAAVVVLGANGDFEGFTGDVYAVVEVELDGGGVEMAKAFNGSVRKG